MQLQVQGNPFAPGLVTGGGGGSPPAAPTANLPTGTTETTFIAHWSASAGATSYAVDVSTSNTFASFVAGWNNTNVGNVTSVTVTGVVPGMLFFRVRAINGSGASGNSNAREASIFCLVVALNMATNQNAVDGGSGAVVISYDNNPGFQVGWSSAGTLFSSLNNQKVSFNIYGIDSSPTSNPPWMIIDGDSSENGPDHNGPINGDNTVGPKVVGKWYFDFDSTGAARMTQTNRPADFQQWNFDGTPSGLPPYPG